MGLKLELLELFKFFCLLGMSFQIFDFNILAKLLLFALFPKKNHQIVKFTTHKQNVGGGAGGGGGGGVGGCNNPNT